MNSIMRGDAASGKVPTEGAGGAGNQEKDDGK